MKPIFRTTAIAVLMALMSATAVFAQNTTGTNTGTTTIIYSITVTITEKGANCPDHGTVKSQWRWFNGAYTYDWFDGTTANYSNVPWTGQVKSIAPYSGAWHYTTEASVNLWPTGHPEAHNAAIVYPPYNPITLNPGTCNKDSNDWINHNDPN